MVEEDDIEAEDGEGDPVAESVIRSTVPSVLHQLGARQQNVAGMLVGDEHLEKLTHFWTKAEPKQYAKMNYMLRVIASIDGIDGSDDGFAFPSFADLVQDDMRFREAYQKGRAKDLVAITKVLERSQEPERGGFLGMFRKRR